MKHKYLFLICLIYLLPVFAASNKPEPFLFGGNSAQIIINNRVLARVNGKPISVIDVMKKMDMIFLRQYPEYAEVPQARFQFYELSWKHVLEDLIDKELILADAEEAKMQVQAVTCAKKWKIYLARISLRIWIKSASALKRLIKSCTAISPSAA